jgi:hypothetical protein
MVGLRIIIEVREMGPHVRKALESHGRIAGENPRERTYAVEVEADGNPERKRICAERISQAIGELGFVISILLPGYRTLDPERWD